MNLLASIIKPNIAFSNNNNVKRMKWYVMLRLFIMDRTCALSHLETIVGNDSLLEAVGAVDTS